jgi:membrane protease YdiL (CAAX protease family)
MLGYLARSFRLPIVYRKLLRVARWAPLLILALALRGWPESVEGPHLWTLFDFGYRGEFRLYLNLELTLSGLALLAIFVHWDACPAWRRLFRPVPLVSVVLMAAVLGIFAAVTLAAIPESIHAELRPLDPFTHPQSWSISIAALLLGAFQNELWNRAILQSTLARMFGNRWIGLGITVILLTLEEPVHRAEIFCIAAFLGVVFIRTQSVACTTALHIAIDLALGVLQGGTFMVASFLSPSDMLGVKALALLSLLLLAIAVELWYRRSPRQTRLIKSFAKNLLLIVFAITLCTLTGKLLRPLWMALVDHNEWMTRSLLWRVNLLAQASVAVIALALLRRGPSLRELLAVRPGVTASLAFVTALMPALAAVIVLREDFRSGHFDPMSPFTTNPFFWLGTVLPVVVGVIEEEVFHRALIQSLLSRLFHSDWAGAIVGALLFAGVHPFENMAFILPGALLFALVFMRTRSIVCTTVLHLTLNVSGQMITGTHFTNELFVSPDAFISAWPLYGALLLALAVAFEWCWRMSAEGRAGRASPPPNERIASGLAAPTSA